MKILYVRHGKKLFSNNKTKNHWHRKHDPPLSKEGSRQVVELAKRLDGSVPPEYVMVSPYRRTQETWAILSDNLKVDKAKEPLVRFDAYVAEYLGNQKFTDRTLFTEKYHPPDHTETIPMLEERVRRHVEELEAMKARGVETVWVVSHGFTIQKILECILRIERDDFYLKEGEMMEVTI